MLNAHSFMVREVVFKDLFNAQRLVELLLLLPEAVMIYLYGENVGKVGDRIKTDYGRIGTITALNIAEGTVTFEYEETDTRYFSTTEDKRTYESTGKFSYDTSCDTPTENKLKVGRHTYKRTNCVSFGHYDLIHE